MINGHGLAHGGYVFLLADTAFAYACNSHGPATVGLAPRSRSSPARLGDELIATAVERTRFGRNGIYDVTVDRVDPTGTTVIAEFRGAARRRRAAMTNRESSVTYVGRVRERVVALAVGVALVAATACSEEPGPTTGRAGASSTEASTAPPNTSITTTSKKTTTTTLPRPMPRPRRRPRFLDDVVDEHVVLDDLHHLHDLVDVDEHYDDHRRTTVHTSAAASTTVTGVAAQQQKLNELFYGLDFLG